MYKNKPGHALKQEMGTDVQSRVDTNPSKDMSCSSHLTGHSVVKTADWMEQKTKGREGSIGPRQLRSRVGI